MYTKYATKSKEFVFNEIYNIKHVPLFFVTPGHFAHDLIYHWYIRSCAK